MLQIFSSRNTRSALVVSLLTLSLFASSAAGVKAQSVAQPNFTDGQSLLRETGEVLALYSEPSYSLKEVDDESTWIKLEANQREGARNSARER